MTQWHWRWCLPAILTLLAMAGCAAENVLRADPAGLLFCPTLGMPAQERLMVPDDSASLRVGSHRLFVPPGGVLDTVTIRMSAPPSNYNHVTIQAVGRSEYAFATPAQLTLSYEACIASVPDRVHLFRIPAGGVGVRPLGRGDLRDLGGVHDAATRSVTAPVPGLSDFVLGLPH